MRRFILLAVVLFAPALAIGAKPLMTSAGSKNLLDGVAANAAEALRTVSVTFDEIESVRCTVALDHTAASALTVQVYRGHVDDDGAVQYGLVQSGALASGTSTLSDYTLSKSVSGDVSIEIGPFWTGDSKGIRFVVAATGGGASDLISLYCSGRIIR